MGHNGGNEGVLSNTLTVAVRITSVVTGTNILTGLSGSGQLHAWMGRSELQLFLPGAQRDDVGAHRGHRDH